MFTHCYPIYLTSKSNCSLFYILKKGNVVFYFHYMFLCIHQNPLMIVDEWSIKDPHSFQKCFFSWFQWLSLTISICPIKLYLLFNDTSTHGCTFFLKHKEAYTLIKTPIGYKKLIYLGSSFHDKHNFNIYFFLPYTCHES